MARRRLFASPYVKNIRRGFRGESGQARGVAPVCFLEDLARSLAVGGLLGQCLRVTRHGPVW
jgi:hypothetical protein